MRFSALRTVLHREPFRPLEIRTSSGEKFLVKHPEAIAVLNRRLVVIGDPDGGVAFFDVDAVTDIRRRNGRTRS